MTDVLDHNTAVQANAIALELAAVPNEDVEDGSPRMGDLALVEDYGVEIGVWEISNGVVTDTEGDETFVVLSGRATVEVLDTGVVLDLTPGTVGRLSAGTRTRWTVTETLRKVYITPAG
jgi:hypothetical protein